MYKNYKELLKIIESNRKIVKKVKHPFKNSYSHIPADVIAMDIYEMELHIERQNLVNSLMYLYASNYDDFMTLVSDEVLKKINFKDKDVQFLYESLDDLATHVQNKKIYKKGNGIFEAWTFEKNEKKPVSIAEACVDCLTLAKSTF